MIIGEINFINLIIWIVFIHFIFGFENTFKSIIVSEFIWISLFSLYLAYSLIFDNITILSLTLFFLIFSAIEISICLILIIFQKKLNKTVNVNIGNNSQNTIIKKKTSSNFKIKY